MNFNDDLFSEVEGEARSSERLVLPWQQKQTATLEEAPVEQPKDGMSAGDVAMYPFQAAGGLAQGAANFIASGFRATMEAEYNTGAINPLSPNNLTRGMYAAKQLFLPFLYDDDDKQAHAAASEQWAKNADKFAKDFDVIFEGAASHPIFDPKKLGRGSEDVQSMLGAFSVWVEEDLAKSAGNIAMRTAENPDVPQSLREVAPDTATLLETGVVALGLMVPYFGVQGAKKAYSGFNKVRKANKTGDIKNTAQGRRQIYNDVRPEKDVRDIQFEFTETGSVEGQLGGRNIGTRPGPTPSTEKPSTFVNRDGALESVQGKDKFVDQFLKANKGASPKAAESAWNEYANEVTRSVYPDAYIAYEMKASGFDALAVKTKTLPVDPNTPNITGRQAYLNHVFDARNTNNIYGYRNTFTLGGEEFNFKDYITYTPIEFSEAIKARKAYQQVEEGYKASLERLVNMPAGKEKGRLSKADKALEAERAEAEQALAIAVKESNFYGQQLAAAEKRIQLGYVEYINSKAAELGMDRVANFPEATERAFELRELEGQRLRIAQEEIAWKERFLENTAPIREQGGIGRVQEPTMPKGLKDVIPSKEGPNYTAEQVQGFFESEAKTSIMEASIQDIINRAQRPITDNPNAPMRTPIRHPMAGKQSGVFEPSVGAEAVTKIGEGIAKVAGKDTLKDATKATTAIGMSEATRPKKGDGKPTFPFTNEARSTFGGKTRHSSGSFIKSTVGEGMGFSNPVIALRQFEKYSPTLKKIIDKFDRPIEGEGRGATTPFSETVKIREADWDQKVRRTLAPHSQRDSGKYGGLSKKENDLLNTALRDPDKLKLMPPAVKAAFERVRKLLDEDFKTKVAANIPGISDKSHYLKNYFHRVYDGNKIRKMEREWFELMEREGVEKEFAQELFDNLTTHDRLHNVEARAIEDFIMEKPGAIRRSSVDYERALARIKDKDLAPFLTDNVYETLSKYGTEWAKRQTYAERFGANSEILRGELMQAALEAKAAGNPMPKWVAQRVYDTAQALDGSYKPIASRTAKTAQRGLITGTNIALMAGVTLSSAAEVALLLQSVSPATLAKALPVTLHQFAKRAARRMIKDIPHGLREQIIRDTSITMDAAVQDRLTSLYTMDFSKVDSAVFKAYGLHHWTKFGKMLAVNSFITHAEGLMKAASEGEKSVQKWMAKGGFNAAKAQQLTKFMDFYGLDLTQGKDWIAKGKPKGHPFYDQMVRGSLRFAEDSVLTPNPAIVPMWHSNPHFAFLKHLRTFQSLMFTRVLTRWGNNFIRNSGYENAIYGTKVASAVAGMSAIAFLVNELKDQMRYGDAGPPYKLSDVGRGVRAIESAGFLGPASAAYDSFNNSTLGVLGTIVGPDIATATEFSKHAINWAKDKNSQSLATFMAKKSGPLGQFKEGREWAAKNYKKGLEAIRGRKHSGLGGL